MGYEFEAPGPYPVIKVEKTNAAYADMILSSMNGFTSETTAVTTYLYDHFITAAETEMSYAFEQMANIELRHFNILGQLIVLLDADPRLWEKTAFGMRYWSPTYLKYTSDIHTLLNEALGREHSAIEKYRKQIERIKDKYITDILARIIEDEIMHVNVIEHLIGKLEKHPV